MRVPREFKAASTGEYIERRMKRGESETQDAAVAGTYGYTHSRTSVYVLNVRLSGERSPVDGRICLDKRDEQIKSNDL